MTGPRTTSELMERIRAENLRRCHYDYGDGDWCEKPKGHEGSHSVFAPKCEATVLDLPEDVSLRCEKAWDHVEAGDPEHRATRVMRWT